MKKWVSNFEATRKNSHQERLDGSSVCPDRLAISIVLKAFYSDQYVGIIESIINHQATIIMVPNHGPDVAWPILAPE